MSEEVVEWVYYPSNYYLAPGFAHLRRVAQKLGGLHKYGRARIGRHRKAVRP